MSPEAAEAQDYGMDPQSISAGVMLLWLASNYTLDIKLLVLENLRYAAADLPGGNRARTASSLPLSANSDERS